MTDKTTQIIKAINQYLSQFSEEERGNKLSQFSMMALSNVINQELLKLLDDDPVKAQEKLKNALHS